MKQLLFFLFSLVLFSGCEFIDPEFSNFSNVKLGKLDGKNMKVDFDVKVKNENPYGFKIKRGDLHVTVNEMDLGTIELNDKIKVKRKSENEYHVPLDLTLSDGALFRIMKLVKAEKYVVKLDGKVRGSIYGISKTFDVHETRSLSSGDLKLDGGLEGILKGMMK